MKKFILILSTLFLVQCGGDAQSEEQTGDTPPLVGDHGDGSQEGEPAVEEVAVEVDNENTLVYVKYVCTKDDNEITYSYMQYKENAVACSLNPEAFCLCEIKEDTNVIYYTTTGSRENCEAVYANDVRNGGTVVNTVVPNYVAEGYECLETTLKQVYTYGSLTK